MAVRSKIRAVLYLAAAFPAVCVCGSVAAQQSLSRLPDIGGLSGLDSTDPRPAGAPASTPPAAQLSDAASALPDAAGIAPSDTSGVAPTDTGAPLVLSPVNSLAAGAGNGASYTTGKPKPKKAKLYKPNPKSSPPLQPLVPYRTAPKALQTVPVLPEDKIDVPQPAPAIAALPGLLIPHKTTIVETDPYAALGIPAGQLRLFPFVEVSGGYETNPNDSNTGAKRSTEARGAAGMDITSNFSSGSLTGSLRGGYADYPQNSLANHPDGNGLADGRIDLGRNDKIDVEGRFGLSTQTPGSPLLAVPGSTYLVDRPVILTEGMTLGETHNFNRLALSLRGTFDRTQFGDGTEANGSVEQFSLDSYNDYGVVARAAYEVTPALVPFAEAGVDKRIHDNMLDLSGYDRNSDGIVAKAGSTFEFTRLLTGSATIGYADRHYADPRLTDLKGPTIDGSLIYTVSPLTTATLTAATLLTETTLPGATGAVSRSISLQVAHDFLRNFTMSATGKFQVNQYEGIVVDETFKEADLKATYKLTRDMQLFGTLSRLWLDSSLVGSSYNNYIFLAGMRFQR